MKVLSANVNWMKGWGNLPELEVLVDTMADTSQLTYRTKQLGGSTMYWAEVPDSPFVNFFVHNPSNERGYGGREFNGYLKDGTRFKVHGPWSSNAMQMNDHFPMVTSVTIQERDGKFPDLKYHGFAIRLVDTVNLVQQCDGADVTIITGYADWGAIDYWLTGSIIRSAMADPEFVAGAYDIAIKMKGMSLADSQATKARR